ncbi:Imidazolonepropionase [Lentibacillus persicus]|uniref:Imidazolonepropionase n=1 Tax=Lentibacillus persicus TaxID=640948 RepID=A0A1I1VZR5_9BACI|nr:amidohydrolase family protein [Lentibacillus persicus]SFD88305.1 Imidazolonepropionase [Lentibacillus persicus]
MITRIRNIRLITSGPDGVIDNGFITFNESEIIDLGFEDSINATKVDIEIDGNKSTILPGLMDCHVHLGMDCSPDPFKQIAQDDIAVTAYRTHQQGQQFIEAGITSVRNLGTRYNVDISYRNAIEEGIVKGPRVFAAGQPIVMTGGHGHPMATEADGKAEVKKAARQRLKAGADLLKLMATGGVLTKGTEPGSIQLSEEEIRSASIEAKHVSRTTSAHAIGCEGVKNAVRGGVTTIEHGTILDDEAIELMLEHGTYLVPTLIAASLIANKKDVVPEYMIRKTKTMVEMHKESFRKAYQAGVKIASGSDAGTPFNYPGLLVDELSIMIEEGLTPYEAITASTITAAQCVKKDSQIGSLEKGKLADLILVDGNPLEDIFALKNIQRVYRGGELMFKKPEIHNAPVGEVSG